MMLSIKPFSPIVIKITGLAAALAFPIASFLFFPHNILMDDAAFTLKYINNILGGNGYRFNAQDPSPVFGSSSFIFTYLAAALKMLLPYSWSNDSFLYIRIPGLAGYAGLLLLFFYAGYKTAWWPGGILSFFIAAHYPTYFIYGDSGLETMFAGVLLTATMLVFYQQCSRRLIFLLCTLLILTKHHFYPVATIIAVSEALLRIWHNPQGKKVVLQELCFWYLLPAAGFLLFCWLYFGNVIPNSLYAKMFFHPQESGGYPYFRYFISSLYAYPTMVSILPLIGLALVCLKVRIAPSPRLCVLFAVMGILEMQVLLLHKQEIHDWYFVDGFIALQIAGILAVIEMSLRLKALQSPARCAYILGLLLLLHGIYYVAGTDAKDTNLHFKNGIRQHLCDFREFLTVLESEKRDLGRYIKQQAIPGQTLLVAHGWPAYDSGLRALDLTGINSKEMLSLNLNQIKILETFEPDFIVLSIFNFSKLTARYQLLHISQDCYRFDKNIWQVWRKKPVNQWLSFEKTRTIMPQFAPNRSSDTGSNHIIRKNPNVIEICFDVDHLEQQVVFTPLPFRQSVAGMYCYMADQSAKNVDWTAQATVSGTTFQKQIRIASGDAPRMLAVGIPKENTGELTVTLRTESSIIAPLRVYLLDPFCINGVDLANHSPDDYYN